ncbi:hypothetical protein N9335_00800 [Crocinitomicaceae bacterium]|nr:hypothetical protein [Crocinitomicaceae bacterium]
MIINRNSLVFLFLLFALSAWSQSGVGYLNGRFINGPTTGMCATHNISIDLIDADTTGSSSEKEATEFTDPEYKRHYDLSPSIRLDNTNLGFPLSKGQDKKINLIPLVDLGVQYNNDLNHRNGMGFLLEARPIKKSYIRIGGLVNLSNTESLNPGNINLTDVGASQKLWVMPMTRLAYTPDEVFSFQVGYDRNFIGSGRRSLFLSDYGKPMPFGQIRATFWHMEYSVNYQFLSESFNGQRQSKYITNHHLSWNILPWLNFGVFEAVVFQPKDTLLNRGYDVEYLNPFVFYRPQEYSMGSSDNVIIGASLNAKIKNTTVYSQVVLDEFLLSEIRARSGWWANKFGAQLGIKGRISDQLYYRVEGNLVRPYTFSHLTPLQVYGHRGSVLAHPYGSNFAEILSELNWSKNRNPKLKIRFFASFGVRGTNVDSLNYGSDIYESYINRPNDFGNYIGQGTKQTFFITNTRTSYPILKEGRIHAFAELQTQYIKMDGFKNLSVLPMIGIRSYLWNDYRNY